MRNTFKDELEVNDELQDTENVLYRTSSSHDNYIGRYIFLNEEYSNLFGDEYKDVVSLWTYCNLEAKESTAIIKIIEVGKINNNELKEHEMFDYIGEEYSNLYYIIFEKYSRNTQSFHRGLKFCAENKERQSKFNVIGDAKAIFNSDQIIGLISICDVLGLNYYIKYNYNANTITEVSNDLIKYNKDEPKVSFDRNNRGFFINKELINEKMKELKEFMTPGYQKTRVSPKRTSTYFDL